MYYPENDILLHCWEVSFRKVVTFSYAQVDSTVSGRPGFKPMQTAAKRIISALTCHGATARTGVFDITHLFTERNECKIIEFYWAPITQLYWSNMWFWQNASMKICDYPYTIPSRPRLANLASLGFAAKAIGESDGGAGRTGSGTCPALWCWIGWRNS